MKTNEPDYSAIKEEYEDFDELIGEEESEEDKHQAMLDDIGDQKYEQMRDERDER